VLDRTLSERASECQQAEDEEWEVGDEYPYCTEPPAPETLALEIPALELREPVELSVSLLRQLEWKRFEELVCDWYRALGLNPQPTNTGGCGGVDINLYQAAAHRPHALVQCKASVDGDAALKLLRELANAMQLDRIEFGEFVTAGEFPARARTFAAEHSIRLVDGNELAAGFSALPIEVRDQILRRVLHGDYRTPTCPSCGRKMVLQSTDTTSFWSCPGFPRCQRRIQVRSA
jgi:restriction system protein